MSTDDFKTVEVSSTKYDSLQALQRKDLAEMRESLLACTNENVDLTSQVQRITAIRIHHQMIRIIRYLDIMDKVESKLYECIDEVLENPDSQNLVLLIGIQSKLQQSMIDSHKLLEPYLNMDVFDNLSTPIDSNSTNQVQILDRSSREKLRESAQEVLAMLDTTEEV